MSEMSYIAVIEHYHQHREAIQDLLGSILTGITEQKLFDDPPAKISARTGAITHPGGWVKTAANAVSVRCLTQFTVSSPPY